MKNIHSNKKHQKSHNTKVEITNSHPKLKPPVSLKSIRNTINLVMNLENCLEYYIFVNILNTKDIKAINSFYLKHNFPTDIITFLYITGKITEGELLLGLDEISKNSVIYKTSIIEEFNRVLIHGCLHLVGYKDKTYKQKELIRQKENFYLNKISKNAS